MAFIFRAGDQGKTVRPCLKCLQEVEEVRFAGTGKADDGVFNAFLFAEYPVKFGSVETVRTIKNI
jgi:hypothetical protein